MANGLNHMISNNRLSQKYIFTLALSFFLSVSSVAKTIHVTVKNKSQIQRREIVSIDARQVYNRLQLPFGSPILVHNPDGLQESYQLTADSLLLVEAMVRPLGSMTYEVSGGVPKNFESFAEGHLYAWRLDDFTWENDLTAYRAYGPALQRTGEKSYGFDVWLKSVSKLVVADRYKRVFEANQEEKTLRQQGLTAQADSVKRENSLHLDHGNGLDCYNVGPSLGCGTPALMLGDSIIMPYCYQRYRILDNGPLRFEAEFVYQPMTINGQKNVVEHRLVSLDKGSYFNRITVWYEHLAKPSKFCSGFVIHSDDTTSLRLGNNFVQYADPTDSPVRHNFQIYVAVLFPYNAVNTRLLPDANPNAGIAGHAIGEMTIQPNQKITYYFGAGWTESGVRNQQMWQSEIDSYMSALASPLAVEITD